MVPRRLGIAVLHLKDLARVPHLHELVGEDAAVPVPVAVHVSGAFPRDHGGEMRWLQLRHMPLIDGVVGDAIKPYLAVGPWSRAGPFDGVIVVERLAWREDVEHAGRAAGTACCCLLPRHRVRSMDRMRKRSGFFT